MEHGRVEECTCAGECNTGGGGADQNMIIAHNIGSYTLCAVKGTGEERKPSLITLNT